VDDPADAGRRGDLRAAAFDLAPENTSVWFKDIDALADMIASGRRRNAMLS